MTPHLMVVGVGDGGCRIADRLVDAVPGLAVGGVSTDARSLGALRMSTRQQIGANRVEGLGTGGDSEIGRLAAEDDLRPLQELVAGAGMVVVVACLGGGTGSGAAPVILQLARDAGAVTVAFAVLPFKFEGTVQREQADHALSGMRPHADVLLVLPNDRLAGFVGDAAFAKTFDRANEVVSSGVASLCRLITQPGYLNLDFSNLQRTLRETAGGGTFGYGEGRGKGRAEAAAKQLLEGPLSDDGRIVAEAKAILVSIVGGPDLALRDIETLMTAIKARAPGDAHLVVGTAIEESFEDRVGVTVIVAEAPRAVDEEPAADPAPAPAGESAAAPSKNRRKDRSKTEQTQLNFDVSDPGRFRGVDPTVLDGENIDVPTFIRRKLIVER